MKHPGGRPNGNPKEARFWYNVLGPYAEEVIEDAHREIEEVKSRGGRF